MATFYTGVDKSIYEGGDHYVPMDQFRLNPYEKNLSYESSQPQSYGITNTNAFTNSGGGGGIGGNVFGYGSAINPGDPSVLTSGPYAGQSGYYGSGNYQGGLPGDIAQKGPGRHFQYDNTGNFYRDYSLTPKKEVPGLARMVAGFIPFGNTALNFIENRMNPEGPLTLDDVNKGRYAVAGLDALDKKAYNELAGSGMLFEGSSGLKTLTGKNFGAKGYFEGQAEIYDNLTGQGFSMNDKGEVVDDEGNVIGGIDKKGNVYGNFKAKQYLEASKMFDFKKEKDKQADIDLQKEIDAANLKDAMEAQQAQATSSADLQNIKNIQQHTGEGLSDYRMSRPESERQFTGHGKSGMGRSADRFAADGGRVGLRYGGLLSIL